MSLGSVDVFVEKNDNLLVEANNFYHFRGLIFYREKYLQLNQYRKQDCSCTVQKYFYSTTSWFFNLIELLVPFKSHKKVLHCDGSIVIFDCSGYNLIFTLIRFCITAFHLKKLCRAHYSFLVLCSCLGITMNLHLYKEKYFVNDF